MKRNQLTFGDIIFSCLAGIICFSILMTKPSLSWIQSGFISVVVLFCYLGMCCTRIPSVIMRFAASIFWLSVAMYLLPLDKWFNGSILWEIGIGIMLYAVIICLHFSVMPNLLMKDVKYRMGAYEDRPLRKYEESVRRELKSVIDDCKWTPFKYWFMRKIYESSIRPRINDVEKQIIDGRIRIYDLLFEMRKKAESEDKKYSLIIDRPNSNYRYIEDVSIDGAYCKLTASMDIAACLTAKEIIELTLKSSAIQRQISKGHLLIDRTHHDNPLKRCFISDDLETEEASEITTEKTNVDFHDELTDNSEIKFKQKNPVKKRMSREDAVNRSLKSLNSMIGLKSVKQQINQLVSVYQIEQQRRARGIDTGTGISSYHMVFSGNPGTGKTTVARVLLEIYKALGIASTNGKFVEVARGDIVASYVGQTAIKVREKVDEARGGILFIDEAYTLAHGGENDFGREAIDTLLKLMEDYRNDLIVIVAGYTNEMKEFIESNPGLESRFSTKIEFDDYDEDELLQILKGMLSNMKLILDSEAENELRLHIEDMLRRKPRNFGNGRVMRNLSERIYKQQALRLSGSENINAISRSELQTVMADDIINSVEM